MVPLCHVAEILKINFSCVSCKLLTFGDLCHLKRWIWFFFLQISQICWEPISIIVFTFSLWSLWITVHCIPQSSYCVNTFRQAHTAHTGFKIVVVQYFLTFIGLKCNNHQIRQICLTFRVYHKWCCLWKRHVWCGIKIQCDICHVCSPSPSGAHCFTYSPSGRSWLLFKRCWWAKNMAQSAPRRCSLWRMNRGVQYRLPFLLECWYSKCIRFPPELCAVCGFPCIASCFIFVVVIACRCVSKQHSLNSKIESLDTMIIRQTFLLYFIHSAWHPVPVSQFPGYEWHLSRLCHYQLTLTL